jgi:glycosyltransferase involved in cell wall biosynthesis
VARTILMISKPIAPPWNDSSKNLVKDLASAGARFTYRVLTPRGYQLAAPQVECEQIYRAVGAHTPPLVQNLRVLARLLRPDRTAITHFFFAPNLKTSLSARAALTLRRRRTVQTVCSTPASFQRAGMLLFAERVVVLSRHTQRQLVDAGVPARRLVMIPPGIQIPDPPSPDSRRAIRARFGLPVDRPVVIYPGDYQFSDAARTVARAILALDDIPVFFVFACRIKQPASLEIEAEIRELLDAGGALPRVLMLREVEDMLALLGACDLCVLPAESLYAKMDLPLVLLEAMALGVPPVVADQPPLCELAHPGAGLTVPPRDPQALARAIRDLTSNPERLGELGAGARAAARRHYSIDAVSRRYETLYEELLAE